jgi:hypothetical protein
MQLHTVQCDLETDTVLNLKQKVASIINKPPYHIKLIYASKTLKDENFLKDYNVQTNSSLTAVVNNYLQRDAMDL